MKNNPNKILLKAKLSMLLACILMGTIGLYVNALPNAIVAACMRGLSAAFFISIFLLMNKKFRSGLKYLKYVWQYMLAEGLNLTLIQYFYFTGMSSGYAMAAFLLYTGGIIALFFNKFILKEEISQIKWVSIILAIIGVAIMLEPWRNDNLADLNILGIVFGLLSGICLAFSILIKKLVYRKLDKIDITYKENLGFYSGIALCRTIFLGVALLPFSFTYIISFTGTIWIVAILIGLLPGALAFSLYNYGLKEDRGGNIIILSYIEPFIASVVNIIILIELSSWVIVGGILIIGANLLILYSDKKKLSIEI